MGKAKPVVIHENNHGNTKLVDPGLKSNNTSWNKRKDDFTNGLTIMMCGIITPKHLQKRMKRGDHTRSQVTTACLNSPKLKTTGDQKQES